MNVDVFGDEIVPVGEEDLDLKKKIKTSPFDFVNWIFYDKKDVMHGEDAEFYEKDYVPFIVNRALSNGIDTVLYANEMNIRPWTDHVMQYDYLMHSVRKAKRYNKWAKRDTTDDDKIQVIIDYYKCSHRVALQYRHVLDDAAIENLKSKMFTGG